MKRRLSLAVTLAILALSLPIAANAQEPVVAIRRPSPEEADNGLLLRRDTPIRLMVMREVTTKTAHAGDRFPLHVDQDVLANGANLIPAGTPAWGEVVSATESGFVGKSGKLGVRLLYIELRDHKIALRGETATAGPGGAGTTVAATVGFALLGAGPLGLLTRGTNAKLKAGEIVTGYAASDEVIAAAPPPALTTAGTNN